METAFQGDSSGRDNPDLTEQIRFVLVTHVSLILWSSATKIVHSGFPGSVSISNSLPLSTLSKKFSTFYLANMVVTIMILPSQNISHIKITPSLLIWFVAIKGRNGWFNQGLRPSSWPHYREK